MQVTVKNTGTVAGAEVAQLYLGYPDYLNEPPKNLKGFDKQFLQAGQSLTFQFQLTKFNFQFYDSTVDSYASEIGVYTFFVGAASDDIRAQSKCTLRLQNSPTCTPQSTNIEMLEY